MRLSVIIVNYNVKFFLRQCLNSVIKALQDIEGEIILIDNDSADGSCAMVKENFPEVILLENKENRGFSRANNQGIRMARGEYVLLLNPDTVVEETSFRTCLSFMETHPDAGAAGVRMIDGKGRFLPESKRGLPTPGVAFYKMSGLGRLFARSRKFNYYYLGHLSEKENHPVEVLTGAFMFLRKQALDKAGWLDETFFMYGEDIDLSYRIRKAGYQNYYLADTTIIHYKGESTKKGSLNYVLHFYKAMMIFARKHFRQKGLGLYILLIQLAIFFRAGLSVGKRLIRHLWKPLFDVVLLYAGFLQLVPLWEKIHFHGELSYSPVFLNILIPSYILIWVLSLGLSGAYSRPVVLRRIFRGLLAGTLFILVIYGLLPLELRFSRALIILGTLMAAILLPLVRILFHYMRIPAYRLKNRKGKRTIITGSEAEYERIGRILGDAGMEPAILGRVAAGKPENGRYLGKLQQLPEIIRVNRAEEVIFSAADLSAEDIIQSMLMISSYNCDIKIIQPDTLSIIGSSSVHQSGEIYQVEMESVGTTHNRLRKRLLDIVTATILLILSPIAMWWIRKPFGLGRNLLLILSGKKSFVGYTLVKESDISRLPKLKEGILHPLSKESYTPMDSSLVEKQNLLYAKKYSPLTDVHLILSCFRQLGN